MGRELHRALLLARLQPRGAQEGTWGLCPAWLEKKMHTIKKLQEIHVDSETQILNSPFLM